MNNTAQIEQDEDIEMVVPEAGSDREVIPAGVYSAKCVRIFTDSVPDWKIQTKPDPEGKQWVWVFEITTGDYAGMQFYDYTTRTLHEKSNAHKHALALMNLPALAPGTAFHAKDLIGLPCRIALSDTNKKGEPRNFIDRVLSRRNPTTAKTSLVNPKEIALQDWDVADEE